MAFKKLSKLIPLLTFGLLLSVNKCPKDQTKVNKSKFTFGNIRDSFRGDRRAETFVNNMCPKGSSRACDNSAAFNPSLVNNGFKAPTRCEDDPNCPKRDLDRTYSIPSGELSAKEERIIKEAGLPPQPGGSFSHRIPDNGDFSFYDKGDHPCGTARQVWRITTAAKILKEKGIDMPVGHASNCGTGTTSHGEHQDGQDLDLRFVGPNGDQKNPCIINQACYDREKTFTMIKALIDVDPTKVEKIFVGGDPEKGEPYDPQILKDINEYYYKKTGVRKNIARVCKKHANHVHMSWKSPDQYKTE